MMYATISWLKKCIYLICIFRAYYNIYLIYRIQVAFISWLQNPKTWFLLLNTKRILLLKSNWHHHNWSHMRCEYTTFGAVLLTTRNITHNYKKKYNYQGVDLVFNTYNLSKFASHLRVVFIVSVASYSQWDTRVKGIRVKDKGAIV